MFFKYKYYLISFSQDCRISRYFTKANSRKGSKSVEIRKRKWLSLWLFVAMTTVCTILAWMKKKCVANLHCECQELKQIHTGVHTVNTVGSQLKLPDSQLQHWKTGIELLCRVQAGVVWVKMAMLIWKPEFNASKHKNGWYQFVIVKLLFKFLQYHLWWTNLLKFCHFPYKSYQ